MSEGNGTGRKIRVISRAQSYQLSKWLRAHKGELADKKLTLGGVLAAVHAGMGLTISEYNLRAVCKDFGIDPFWARKNATAGPAREFARGQLSRIVARQVLFVAEELERVCGLLGETFNPEKKIDPAVLWAVVRGRDAEVKLPEAAEGPPVSEAGPRVG